MIGTKRPFASVMQTLLIGLLGFSFLLIAQQYNRDVYQWGVLLLIIFTLLQMAFGNIPSSTGFVRSLFYLGIAALFQLADGAQVVSAAVLRGLGDTALTATNDRKMAADIDALCAGLTKHVDDEIKEANRREAGPARP